MVSSRAILPLSVFLRTILFLSLFSGFRGASNEGHLVNIHSQVLR